MMDPSKLHLPIQPLTYATVAGRVKRKRVITVKLHLESQVTVALPSLSPLSSLTVEALHFFNGLTRLIFMDDSVTN
jgi:hypothetical protein